MIANDVHAPANVPSSVRPAPEKTPYVTVNRLASRAIFHCPPSLRSIVSVQPARRTAAPPGRRHDDIEVVTQIGPVAEHLEFANIARSFNTDVAHALRHGGERLLAEWLAPQNHEHHIVRHEAQYSLQFAGRRQRSPSSKSRRDHGWRLRRGTSRVLLHPMKIDHRYRSATSPSRSTSQARSMAPRAPTERSAAKAWPVSHRVL